MKFTFPPNSQPLEGYTIKRGIHRGGFGEVYYAHTSGGKEVALKLLQSHMEVELRGVRQCLNLKHPHLVSLYDIRTDEDGDHWIVMEYVAGRTLADVLDEHSDGLPVEDVATWLDGMAAGLEFLHDRGIVHRDLKPGNVFIENGVVKIGDVGLSKYISQSRRNEQTQSVGTVYYMAPEVAHGRYGREVDVYSLGIVLFELLTGRVPFDGESTGEILMKHLSEEPNLSEIAPELRPILARSLEKDPTLRTPSPLEVASGFRDAVTDERVVVGARADATGVAATAVPGAERFSTPAFSIPEVPQPDDGEPANDPPGLPGDSSSAAESVTSPETEEQVARTPWERLKQAWHGPNATSVRWTTATVVVLLFLSGVGFILLGFGLAVWVVKLLIDGIVSAASRWHRVSSTSARSVEIEMVPTPPSPQPIPVRVAKSSEWLTPETARVIPMRQRIAELTGSLAYAAPLTALVTVGLLIATPVLPFAWYDSGVYDVSGIGLFAAVTLLGSWAILATAKLGEGRPEYGLQRRVLYGVVGCVVGVLAFHLQRDLFVQLNDGVFNRPDAMFDRAGGYPLRVYGYDHSQPSIHAYMLFFGLLFAVRRWWWHVDAFRSKRFRVWTLLATTTVGFVLPSVFLFPHMWGMLWAASICCVVQLAAAWQPPESRHAILRREVV